MSGERPPEAGEAPYAPQWLHALVEQVDLQAVMVPVAGEAIVAPESFSLTALGRGDRRDGRTQPEDPSIETYDGTGEVYLDGAYAIGLVHDRKLIAVASADRTSKGSMFVIRQLQDVTGVRRARGHEAYAKYKATGLQSGFAWRHTLVRAWEQVAEEAGASYVVVQSHENSAWPEVKQHGAAGYDQVAQTLQYQRDPVTKNWTKVL